MDDYGLKSDEYVILKTDDVTSDGSLPSRTGELVLTNQNLIWVHKGISGKVKGLEKLPLNRLKVIDGRAQVRVEQRFGEMPELELYFYDRQVSFEFGLVRKRELQTWVDAINAAANGLPVDVPAVQIQDSPVSAGIEMVTETASSVAGMFGIGALADGLKGALGLEEKRPAGASRTGDKQRERVQGKCCGCGAQLSGFRGASVCCPYCDTRQAL